MISIEILLATYNGEKYIRDLIHSLWLLHRPNGTNIRVLVSDDGSTDGTLSIVEGLQKRLCNDSFHINIISGERVGGVLNNFKRLIDNSDADYSFFCDQDDFWLPNKLELFMTEFNLSSSEKPILVHSDLCVVDKYLHPKQISMFDYQVINKNPTVKSLLVQNSVTGCVMALNRCAMTLLKNATLSKSIMHDWYAAILVSTFGEIRFIPESTILYRQHDSNQLGAKKLSLLGCINDGEWRKKYDNAILSIKKTREQAIVLLQDFGSEMTPSQRSVIESYIHSFERNYFERVNMLFHGFRKKGVVRNFFFFHIYLHRATSCLK